MHLLTTLLGIYFLGTSLEERWGTKRFLYFVVGSAWFASLLQFGLSIPFPKLQEEFYGGIAMVDAVAIAWARAFKDRKVNLMFVLPVSARTLILFTIALNVLYVIAVEGRHEGIVSPFGGMLAGYLFADGSPLRRFYLQMRFKQLQKQSASLRTLRAEGTSRLRVIEGGASKRPRQDHAELIRGPVAGPPTPKAARRGPSPACCFSTTPADGRARSRAAQAWTSAIVEAFITQSISRSSTRRPSSSRRHWFIHSLPIFSRWFFNTTSARSFERDGVSGAVAFTSLSHTSRMWFPMRSGSPRHSLIVRPHPVRASAPTTKRHGFMRPAKGLSCFERLGWRSLRSAFASIWRMRSRVTSKSCPTSSSV